MKCTCPGPAYIALVVSYAMLVAVTIAGRVQGDNWNTISDMITRNPRLRNAFAMIVGWLIVSQIYYVKVMYSRWSRISPHSIYWSMIFISIGIMASAGGSVGFAIVSTDISSKVHDMFAGVAFAGMYMYLVAFMYLSHQSAGNVLSDTLARAFMLAPVLYTVICAIWWSSMAYSYMWEFVFVTSMFGAACALFVPASVNIPEMHVAGRVGGSDEANSNIRLLF